MGENLTASDETGARAERLATIRRDVGRYDSIHLPANLDISFVLHELDRVTAERDRVGDLLVSYKNDLYFCDKARIEAKDLGQRLADNLDTALASRNAWAAKAVERGRVAAIDTSRKHVEEIENLRQDVKRLREALREILQTAHPPWPQDRMAQTTLLEAIRGDADRALAAMEPIETIENPIDATEPKP